jgi:hypothetical protein
VVAGSSQLAVQVLNEVAKLLGKLNETQMIDLAEGRALIEFRSSETTITSRPVKKAAKPKAPAANLDDIIRDIKAMDEEDAVERYLFERDKTIGADALKELAARLGPHISRTGTKPQLRKNIAAGTAGLLNRPASAFGEAWSG